MSTRAPGAVLGAVVKSGRARFISKTSTVIVVHPVLAVTGSYAWLVPTSIFERAATIFRVAPDTSGLRHLPNGP
jgi:hypothetical protein